MLHPLLVTCPDGRQRIAKVSDREWRKLGRSLRWDSTARVAGRVQANGLSVYGTATLDMASPDGAVWRFTANHGGSPAFLNRAGREIAARILIGAAQHLNVRGTVRDCGAVLAACARARRLLGKRGNGLMARGAIGRYVVAS